LSSKRLTSAEARAYRDDGFFVRAPDFSEAELTELRTAAERSCATAAGFCSAGRHYRLDGNLFVGHGHTTVQFEHVEHAQPRKLVRVIEPVQDLDPRFDTLIDDARLVDPMLDLVGCPRIALWTAKLNLKPPLSGSGFGWHQDSPYWAHNCAHLDRLPNVMLAIDDADAANGCLRILRGSHKHGCLPGRGVSLVVSSPIRSVSTRRSNCAWRCGPGP